MERVPEPELMDAPAQAAAYAAADFSQAHDQLIDAFRQRFPDADPRHVIDLGCGPADVTIRFARAFPKARIHGLDAGPNMLTLGRQAVAMAGMEDRIQLELGHLPEDPGRGTSYDTIISNSLLHHLNQPGALWQTLRRIGAKDAYVAVMDLIRPRDRDELDIWVERYAGDAPAVLREDFRHSLRAAYRPVEVKTQLDTAKLSLKVDTIGDRHLLVWGRLTTPTDSRDRLGSI